MHSGDPKVIATELINNGFGPKVIYGIHFELDSQGQFKLDHTGKKITKKKAKPGELKTICKSLFDSWKRNRTYKGKTLSVYIQFLHQQALQWIFQKKAIRKKNGLAERSNETYLRGYLRMKFLKDYGVSNNKHSVIHNPFPSGNHNHAHLFFLTNNTNNQHPHNYSRINSFFS
jgi:hypothetical protein